MMAEIRAVLADTQQGFPQHPKTLEEEALGESYIIVKANKKEVSM